MYIPLLFQNRIEVVCEHDGDSQKLLHVHDQGPWTHVLMTPQANKFNQDFFFFSPNYMQLSYFE